MSTPKVVIIGGGAAGLFAAALLSDKAQIEIYEKERTVGRKFLVAGSGGFNITNAVSGEELYRKYSPESFIKSSLQEADTKIMVQWLESIGVGTFVGSSGRVFPSKGIKPHQVLKAITNHILNRRGMIFTGHQLSGINSKLQPEITLVQTGEKVYPKADAYIYALGGASWPVTGSDGKWPELFHDAGMEMLPFEASNCGIAVDWSDEFRKQFSGTPIKNAVYKVGTVSLAGEALITDYGLEGNAIYPLVPEIRMELNRKGLATIEIDFKPQQDSATLLRKLQGKKPGKDYAPALNLSPVQMQLIKSGLDKDAYLNPEKFVSAVKHVELKIQALRPIAEAISVVGGFPLNQLESNWQVKGHPKVFVIGEMADWDAPTGGFLLQGCFASAYHAVETILHRHGIVNETIQLLINILS